MPADENFRQAEFAAERAHLILEEFAQRLDKLHLHPRRQAADIVMRLDRDTRAALERDAFDHVGIERALREKVRRATAIGGDLLRLFVEDIDEQLADDLALLFRLLNAIERFQERLARIDMDERDVVMAAKQRDDLLGLALAQQPMIDEDAGEPVADRLMDQQRGDG